LMPRKKQHDFKVTELTQIGQQHLQFPQEAGNGGLRQYDFHYSNLMPVWLAATIR